MKRALWVAVAILLAGCFPITVSVAPDGRIALVREEGVIVYDLAKDQANLYPPPEEGLRAAWAQFSSDGKRLLYVMERENGPRTLYIADGVGGAGKKLYTTDNPLIWALWSPDGKRVSVGEVSRQATRDLGNLVSIKSVAVDTGEVVEVAADTLPFHDWTADSTSIVAVVVKKKIGDSAFAGTLTQFALDGKSTPLAEIVGGEDATLDVTPDGKDVLVTASAAGKPGEDLEPPAEPARNCLFSCSIEKKDPVMICDTAMACAFSSPDGRRIAAIRTGEKTKADLIVLNRDGKKEKVLATGVVNNGEGVASARFLPAWASNDAVIFWKVRVVIGTSGQAVTTMSVKLDGSAPVNLQPRLDLLAERAK